MPPDDVYRSSTVRDISAFPQDLAVYARLAGADTPLWNEEKQAELARRYIRNFYAAWSITAPGKGNLEYFRAQLDRRGQARGYAENLQPWDDGRWDEMKLNADLGRAPSMLEPAITVAPASLRLAPTSRPRFVHPTAPGQGFPFDEFQQSALPPGFPLMILHRSLDGLWLYVESALASGWIDVRDVALAGPGLRGLWQSLPLAAVIRDDFSPVAGGTAGQGGAGLGTLLPAREQNAAGFELLLPIRDEQGQAVIRQIRAGTDQAALFPLAATAGSLAGIGNQLLGQAYGWGGMYGNRDCSSMLRDLFTPVGLWLPRNSAAQGSAGEKVTLAGLDAAEKEALIKARGLPFASLLWLRGHITLYLGQYQGQAAMLHNLWGIRTDGPDGVQGRHILGRAVVTSTRPGSELPNVSGGRLLLQRMETLTILGR